jgi:hypothetical protein
MCWPLTGRCSFERPLTPESDIPPPRLRLGVSPSTRSFLPRHLTRESLNRPISSSEQSNQPFGLRVHRAAVIRDWEETFDLTPLPPIFFSPEIPQDPGISLVTMGSRQPEIVDLTSNPTRQTPINLSSSPLASGFASSSRNGEHAPRGIKRPRTDEPCSSSASSDVWPGRQAIETIDMTEDSHAAELAKAVAKQREDAIKAQQSGAEKDRTKTALMAYTCPICMDTPVDATATSCGKFLMILVLFAGSHSSQKALRGSILTNHS